MTTLSGTFRFYPGNRLFDPVHKIILINSILSIALDFATFGRVRVRPQHYNALISHTFNLEVQTPALRPLLFMARNIELPFVGVRIQHMPQAEMRKTVFNVAMKKFAMGLITPIYVDFYEEHKKWIETKFKKDLNEWPPVLNFGRAIRNFASHGNRVHFRDLNAQPISWYHITYSPQNNTNIAIGSGGEIDMADLVVLMIEMSHELDMVGCPYPL